MWDKMKGTVGKKELEKYYDPSPGSDEEQQVWERRAARFNQMDRYVTLRNPNTGGLGIAVVKENQGNGNDQDCWNSLGDGNDQGNWNNQGNGNDQDSWNNQGSRYHQGFNQEALEEIYENCMEILVSRDVPYARGIYPLRNGDYIAMMAKKITGGNAFESRPHEICRGIILEESELEFFCHNILAEPEGGVKFFFPEDEFDPDHPENWRLPSADELREMNHGNLKYWLDELDYRQVIGLGSALKAVSKENMKIQLALPMEQQESMFSALCCISSLVKERLFILLNGECPMCTKGPDILVTDEIRYDHEVRYSFMTLEDFIAMGLRMSYGLDLADNDDGDEETVKEKVLSVLELCRVYVTDNSAAGYDVYGAADHRARYDMYDTTDHRATEYDVYEAALRLQEDSQKVYALFREKLRAYLFHLFPGDYCEENYIKLLYLVYRREPDPHDYSLEIKAGPYEFGKMSVFLKKKFKGRTLKRHLSLMVEILFQDQDNAEFFKALGIKKTLF